MSKQVGPKADKVEKASKEILMLAAFGALSVLPLGLFSLELMARWGNGKEVDALAVAFAAALDFAWIAGALRIEYLRDRDWSQDTGGVAQVKKMLKKWASVLASCAFMMSVPILFGVWRPMQALASWAAFLIILAWLFLSFRMFLWFVARQSKDEAD